MTAVAFYQLSYITLEGEAWYHAPPLIFRASVLVSTPLAAAISNMLAVLSKYWATYPFDLPVNHLTPLPPSAEGSEEN